MHLCVQAVRDLCPLATLDTCPYDAGENGTGYFIRNGHGGAWLSKVRKTPRAAWDNAGERIRAKADETKNALFPVEK